MGESDDARRRRVHMDDARRMVTGVDVSKSASEDDKQAQRFKLAEVHRQFYDAGFDPLVMIEMMLAGACFFGDNHGVSRQQMAKIIEAIDIGQNRQLIYTGKGS